MKFGGTSVGSVNSILSVKKIVESAGEPVIVVVSALGGITDQLISTSRMAATGDAAYEGAYREIVRRHEEMVKGVIPAGETQTLLHYQVNELLDELKDIFQGIYLIKDLSPKTSDTIVSYGERLSSLIASRLIQGAVWFDSRTFIKTEKKHNKHTLDTELTNRLVREAFKEIPQVSLVPGFISSDKVSGDVTNLGRGGSDYTAAVIAAALGADSLEIWTDVDGFMTADPRVISTAYTISELTYVEATELCNFGAKVVYPPTIYPVCHKNIPILIKNTFNPDGQGTVIKQNVDHTKSKAIKGISSINDTSLITVQGLGMVGVIGVNYRIFKALAKNGISVFLVSQASSENSTSIGVRNADADLACEVLNEEFAKEIEMGEISPIQAEKNLATVAIVGENMKHTPGIAGKLFGTLGRNGINVIACAQGASETNISFVVDSKSLRKSLNVIHLACAAHWEKVMSAMDAESGLARLNAAEYGISVPVSPELERVLLLALDYARLTNGAFDPTLGPCIRLWKKSRRLGILPSGEERECALRACGWEKLSVRKGMAVKAVSGMRLDLGGMGKGFAVDRMAEMLKTRGVCSFFIDSTSDVLAGAPPPGEPGWRLRVDTGNGQGEVLLLSHAAVSTSGSARQMVKIGGKAYSHVLDPRSGLGVTEGRQVSVRASSAALADALATAGCVMREEEFRSLAAGLPGVSVPAFFQSPPCSAGETQKQDGLRKEGGMGSMKGMTKQLRF